MSSAVLKTQQKNHSLWAVINRPEAHNAINFEVMDALESVLDRLEGDLALRAFVLRGCGSKSFISGGDLREFHTLETAEEAEQMARRMHDILRRIEELPCWTIACINGPAYGGGCETMLAFDFRVAAHTATFGFTQGKFYLTPGWGGLTRLIEQVGRSTALKWLAEAAVIDAEIALGYKLIDKVMSADNLIEQTDRWLSRITKNHRDYISALKQGRQHITKVRREAIEAELKPFARLWEDQRHHQRVEKFLNRSGVNKN